MSIQSVPRRPVALRVLIALAAVRPPRKVARVLAWRWSPIVALVLILGFSFAARVYDINQPCTTPCTDANVHTLIFDESFYVNAARSILGVAQPSSSPYVSAPAGVDPNAEHPMLAKLGIAAGMEIFGDNGWGWRIGSVVFSLIAMCALYALVRAAGGSSWLAVGAVAVMALDNLALVHGRIATLDIYAVALMLIAALLYVRRRPLLAGVALGVGMCMKEVAVYLLASFAVYTAVRFVQGRWGERLGAGPAREPVRPWIELRAFALAIVGTAAAFFGLLALLDTLIHAWDPGTQTLYTGNPFAHFSHIVKFAQALKENTKHPGIASTPLQWLIDKRTIPYATTAVTVTSPHGIRKTPLIDFRGEINPFVIFLAIPALLVAVWSAWRHRDQVALVGASWTLGTYGPFLVQSEALNRTSYLFYMLIVLPGIYVMTARLFSGRYVPRLATVVWVGLLVYGFVHLYPFRTIL